MGEDGKNMINTEQPNIPHESYLASYVTALDLRLQGIISLIIEKAMYHTSYHVTYGNSIKTYLAQIAAMVRKGENDESGV